MSDDQHGDRHPEGAAQGGRWDPLPQGDYDDGATAFVQLPEGGVDALLEAHESPLAAPGHGYTPPQITVTPATTGTDPAATGTWTMPAAPVDGAQWHVPDARQQAPDPYGADAGYQQQDPYGAAGQQYGAEHGYGHPPAATGHWDFSGAVPEAEAAAVDGSAGGGAPGHDVTGQWSIPVAGGDLPDESGEFTASSLAEQWGGTAPATLPGGAPAPWAAQEVGQPWSAPPAHGRPTGPGHPADHAADYPAEHAAGHPAEQRDGAVAAPEGPAGPSAEPFPAPASPEGGSAASGGVREPVAPVVTEPQEAGAPQGAPAPERQEPEQAGDTGAEASTGAPGDARPEPGHRPGPEDEHRPGGGHAPGPAASRPEAGTDPGAGAEPGTGSAPGAHAGPEAGPEPVAETGPAPVAEAGPAPVAAAESAAGSDAAHAPGTGQAPDAGTAHAPDAEHAPGTGQTTDADPGGPDAAPGPDADPGARSAAGGEPGAGDRSEPGARPGDAAPDAEAESRPEADAESRPDAGPTPDSGATPDAVPGADADAGPEGAVSASGAAGDGAGPAPAGAHAEHPLASYVLRVNGTDRPVTDAWIGESLLYVLRERLGLAGAKDGCSQGECGACNVQVDGRLVASCLVPAVTAAGSEVRTVEGLAADGRPSDVQRALARCGAVQCGFCVPGMAMTVHDLLEGNPAPTRLEARQALCGNLCRCSGYRGVLRAVEEVVAEREALAAADAAAGQDPSGDGEPRIPHQAGPGAGGVHASVFGTAAPAQAAPGDPHGDHPGDDRYQDDDHPHGDTPYGQDGGHA